MRLNFKLVLNAARSSFLPCFLTKKNAALRADKNNIQRKKVGRVQCDCEEVGVHSSEMCNLATIVCLPCCSGGARFHWIVLVFLGAGGGNDIQWCFSQVKGAVDDDVAEGKRDIFYCFVTFSPFLVWGDVKYPSAAVCTLSKANGLFMCIPISTCRFEGVRHSCKKVQAS